MTALPPPDSDLPELGLLLSEDATRLLTAGLGGIDATGARPAQVRYVPGRSVTVSYRLTPSGPGSPATAVARAGRRLPAEATVVSDGTAAVAVWTPRSDPQLPGLKAVLDRTKLEGLLAEVGIREAIERVRIRSYRPGRRAVVELRTGTHRLFVKVVRPDRIALLQEAHVAVAARLRVPRSLGWSPDLGLALLEALPGRSLRASISDGTGRPLPGWAELSEVLDRLPELPNERPGLLDRLPAHHRLLARLVPDQAAVLESLAEQIGTAPPAMVTPAHNDFHSEQILLSEGGIGVIDIDTAGAGRRIDDAALLIGHLFSSALGTAGAGAVAAYGTRLLAGCERELDRRGLRLRVAAAVLAFATGPFRRLQDDWPTATRQRIRAAAEWADGAGG